jgi:hypothetical protein
VIFVGFYYRKNALFIEAVNFKNQTASVKDNRNMITGRMEAVKVMERKSN